MISIKRLKDCYGKSWL